MLSKPRVESQELKLFRYLHKRMNFSGEETNYFWSLEKGFKGEKIFDEWMECLSEDGIILRDLLLQSGSNIFQIDTLFITPETTYIFEVKNYDGDYYIDNGRWYSKAENLINNPLEQLNRCETLFRKLVHSLGFNLTIKGFVIFVNPEFFLYHAPLNLPIVFPTQRSRFINSMKLANRPKLKDYHYNFAKQLVSLHLKESPYTRIPKYQYNELKKGITCESCSSFLAAMNPRGQTLICQQCGYKDIMKSAVLRSVEEFSFLFPERKITTSGIREWCQVIPANKRIKRVLERNFTFKGHGKSAHYVISKS